MSPGASRSSGARGWPVRRSWRSHSSCFFFTPVTVHAPIRVTEALVLTVGLAVMLAANLFFVRRALAPLRDLEAQMDQIDLRNPELRRGRNCS